MSVVGLCSDSLRKHVTLLSPRVFAANSSRELGAVLNRMEDMKMRYTFVSINLFCSSFDNMRSVTLNEFIGLILKAA